MDFQPFAPPPSDHHPLNTGLSSEHGVSAKGFVEGVNAAFKHLFGLVDGKHADDADRIAALEEALAAAQIKVDAGEAHVKALLESFDKIEARVAALEKPQVLGGNPITGNPDPAPTADKTV